MNGNYSLKDQNMKLIKSKKASENYLSKIVKIDTFRKHNDPAIERLKCCTIDGFNMITGIESEPGLYVYFPALSQINSDFLSYANLYRHKELNKDPEQSGMFEDNGRVKAIKLRGSEDMTFTCQLEDGRTFEAMPVGTREEKAEYVKNFETKYKGHKVECTYFNLSENGIPTQPKARIFRFDLE